MESDSMNMALASAPVGVAIVGTGKIADQHLAALRQSPRATAVRLVDTDPARATQASYQHGGIPASTSLDDVLSDPSCRAVIICTPNNTHASIARACLDAGRHVLVEKPMATTVADAYDLVRAAAGSGVTVAAAHTHRAHDYSRAVRAALDESSVGPPLLIRLAVLGGWIWGDWNAWVTRPEVSGGHALHNGVHLLDTVRWWMQDEPRRVHARGQRLSSANLRIDDHLEMTVEFAGGGVAVCEMSRGHHPKAYAARDVVVVGERGVVSLADGADSAMVRDEGGVGFVPARVSNAFLRQLDAWVDGMHGGAPLATGWDGLVSVAMANAVDESIRTGQPVDLEQLLPAGDAEVTR